LEAGLSVAFEPVVRDDAEALVALRIAAMSESRERFALESRVEWDSFYVHRPRT